MQELMETTCVKFVPKTIQDVDYALIVKGYWCSSPIGFKKTDVNPHVISLSRPCMTRETILHELMHTLGFFHEHNRPDRDDYIKIIWDNIINDTKVLKNFKINSMINVTYLDTRYDYHSVMHYQKDAWSKNSLDTIVPRRSDVKIESKGLSTLDISRVNKLYGCTQLIRHGPPNQVQPTNVWRQFIRQLLPFGLTPGQYRRFDMRYFADEFEGDIDSNSQSLVEKWSKKASLHFTEKILHAVNSEFSGTWAVAHYFRYIFYDISSVSDDFSDFSWLYSKLYLKLLPKSPSNGTEYNCDFWLQKMKQSFEEFQSNAWFPYYKYLKQTLADVRDYLVDRSDRNAFYTMFCGNEFHVSTDITDACFFEFRYRVIFDHRIDIKCILLKH